MRTKNLFTFITILIFLNFCTNENPISDISNDSINIDTTIKAFETAEGYGAYSKGGRGGQVIYVTNLNNDGPGSFREAISVNSPRTILFAVSGVIRLETLAIIENPYITIAGQSAPGKGITFTNSGIYTKTHDVIIRHIRIRPGDSKTGHDYNDRDAITIGEKSYNVMVDHVSASWSVDEIISTFYKPQYISVQWSIFSEALSNAGHIDEELHIEEEHSKAFLVGDGSKYVSVHKNLFAHNNDRAPVQVKGGVICDVINNINYNWGEFAFSFFMDYEKSGVIVNLIGNYFKKGNSTIGNFFTEPNTMYESKIYVGENVGDDSLLMVYNSNPELFINNKDYLYDSPVGWGNNIVIYDIENYTDSILDNVGAILPERDSIDLRIINDVRFKQGKIIDSQDDVGGYPVWEEIILNTAELDSIDGDRDGMNDNWEKTHGLNSNNSEDANSDRDNDGYTNLEEYLNNLHQ